mmetsp:Transcript_9525/g.19209  ORF Transcript_9525/g.19209 Transcript_9525/m.19209 type:complete len:204 (+) Transcript_9525:260-871(+)
MLMHKSVRSGSPWRPFLVRTRSCASLQVWQRSPWPAPRCRRRGSTTSYRSSCLLSIGANTLVRASAGTSCSAMPTSGTSSSSTSPTAASSSASPRRPARAGASRGPSPSARGRPPRIPSASSRSCASGASRPRRSSRASSHCSEKPLRPRGRQPSKRRTPTSWLAELVTMMMKPEPLWHRRAAPLATSSGSTVGCSRMCGCSC